MLSPLRRIFAEGEPDWLEEHSRTELEPQQVVELLDTQNFFELLTLPYPTERAGVIDRLLGERLIDEINGRYAISLFKEKRPHPGMSDNKSVKTKYFFI